MLRSLIRTALIALVTVTTCLLGLVTTAALTSRPAPPAAFRPTAVPLLVPDSNRAPTVPTVRDATIIGGLPPGLGVGTIPPGTPLPLRTNSWWSSGALETWPAPVYPLPFKGIFTSGGLTVSVPRRRIQDKAVLSGEGDELRITANKPATRASVIVTGDWDATYRIVADGQPQFDATFIQGSPFVFIRSGLPSLTVAIPPGSVTAPRACGVECGSALTVRAPHATFVLVSPVRDAFHPHDALVDIDLEQGFGFFTVAAVAPGTDASVYLGASMRPYVRTTAEFAVLPTQVRTTFRFPAKTLMGLLPHHAASLSASPGKLVGAYDTIRGQVRLYAGDTFTTVLQRPSIIPSLPPAPSLKFDMNLRSTLQREIGENAQPAASIYFGAKDIYRSATLAELADLVGDSGLRDRAVAQARTLLRGFCTQAPESRHRFGYDAQAGGIIALQNDFGSEHYNDHHFHYGYFLHAAAIVGRYDPAFLKQYGDCFRLLARDIASSDRNDPSFPYLRYFDPYGGHSWAGGLTLFGDANNQESASEAAHAWYGLALFGRTTGDKKLEDLGTWLLAQEDFAERVYWLDAEPKADTIPNGFPYPMVSIIWGGKMDYATFFDASDAAIRGIQFFPVTPALFPVLDRAMVARVVSPTRSSSEMTMWKSGLALVDMLYNPAISVAPEHPIDPVYGRSGVEYWQRAIRELGEPLSPITPCAGYLFKKDNTVTAAIYRTAADPELCTFLYKGKKVELRKRGPGWQMERI